MTFRLCEKPWADANDVVRRWSSAMTMLIVGVALVACPCSRSCPRATCCSSDARLPPAICGSPWRVVRTLDEVWQARLFSVGCVHSEHQRSCIVVLRTTASGASSCQFLCLLRFPCRFLCLLIFVLLLLPIAIEGCSRYSYSDCY